MSSYLPFFEGAIFSETRENLLPQFRHNSYPGYHKGKLPESLFPADFELLVNEGDNIGDLPADDPEAHELSLSQNGNQFVQLLLFDFSQELLPYQQKDLVLHSLNLYVFNLPRLNQFPSLLVLSELLSFPFQFCAAISSAIDLYYTSRGLNQLLILITRWSSHHLKAFVACIFVS